MLSQLEQWKKENLSIVFTNGCFDILHPGHIDYLEKAAALGDKLVIGLNSDDSVKRLKGKDRPINTLNFRKKILEGLRSVDLVISFEDDTPLELIKKIEPDILCKGGDYAKEQIVGYQFMQSRNKATVILEFLEGYSTSQIIAQIRQ